MGDIFSGGGGSFVDAAMKAKLASKKVAFAITGVEQTTNSFGTDVCAFEIVISSKAAKLAKDAELEGEYVLELSAGPVRERQASALAKYLVNEAQYGPAYLDQVTAKNGRKVWAITDEPGDGQVEAVEYDGGAPAADTADDDDIPF